MITGYKHVRILISLLKQFNVRYFVISPGSRNLSLVKSIEDDPFFTCFSVVDERSASYFAIGVSLKHNAPVAICCTSAQATRNYFPGLTEAFYRKVPILAITGDYDEVFTGQMNMQSIQQMQMPRDTAKLSLDIPIIKDSNDEILVNRRINFALNELMRNGGGPVHLNLRINQHWILGEEQLEQTKQIFRYTSYSERWPKIDINKKILVVVGQKQPYNEACESAINFFVEVYNAVIYVNHISNYNGKNSIHGNRVLFTSSFEVLKPDLVISIGGFLGDYAIDGKLKNSNIEHWRVNLDGEFGDTYHNLTSVFECPDDYFFNRLTSDIKGIKSTNSYFNLWKEATDAIKAPLEIPLSQLYIAQIFSKLIPENSTIHFGILNSLRNWELFDINHSIKCYSNVAGFGIDGNLSTFLGHAMANDDKNLSFLVIGDLAFFYDMNSLGIRGLKNNFRIILINNHGGGEFRLFSHAADNFGDASNKHVAAAGHFGHSAEGWVRNNNFDYLAVNNKEELLDALNILIKPSEKSIVLEVFTTMENDSEALEMFLKLNTIVSEKDRIKQKIVENIPTGLKTGIKKVLGRN